MPRRQGHLLRGLSALKKQTFVFPFIWGTVPQLLSDATTALTFCFISYGVFVAYTPWAHATKLYKKELWSILRYNRSNLGNEVLVFVPCFAWSTFLPYLSSSKSSTSLCFLFVCIWTSSRKPSRNATNIVSSKAPRCRFLQFAFFSSEAYAS